MEKKKTGVFCVCLLRESHWKVMERRTSICVLRAVDVAYPFPFWTCLSYGCPLQWQCQEKYRITRSARFLWHRSIWETCGTMTPGFPPRKVVPFIFILALGKSLFAVLLSSWRDFPISCRASAYQIILVVYLLAQIYDCWSHFYLRPSNSLWNFPLIAMLQRFLV